MRKALATTAAVVLLTAGLSGTAWAAAPDAPTDVQVSWTDDGKVRVTWKDTGEANQVVLSSSASQYLAAEPAAADPNELLLDPSIFRDQAEMRVSLRTVVDQEKSAPAYSPVFDTRRMSKPSLVSAVSSSGTSVRMWLQRDAITDKNPADPLDLPGGGWLKATVSGPAAGQQTEISLPAGSSDSGSELLPVDVPVQPGSVTIKLSTGNEWGTAPIYGTVQVGTMRVSAALPARELADVHHHRQGLPVQPDRRPTDRGRHSGPPEFRIPVEIHQRHQRPNRQRDPSGHARRRRRPGVPAVGLRDLDVEEQQPLPADPRRLDDGKVRAAQRIDRSL
ncbi:hypothetical protein ACI2LF_09210 [Kribbella sp. NPDC020789]